MTTTKKTSATNRTSGFLILPRINMENIRDKMLYFYLFERANFADSEVCKRGELITSLMKLENETGWTYAKIRGSIKRLEDFNLITTVTLPVKSGTKIIINDYDQYQDLNSYSKSNLLRNEERQEKNKPLPHPESKQIVSPKPDVPINKVNGLSIDNKQNNMPDSKQNTKRNSNNITETFNQIFKQQLINKKENSSLLSLFEILNGTNLLITSTEDTRDFVNFFAKLNNFINDLDTSTLVNYLNCIRFTRPSKKISLVKVVNFLSYLENFSVTEVEQAIKIHVANHTDKNEAYTKGILKNLINNNKATHPVQPLNSNEIGSVSQPRYGRRVQEREERLRKKGFLKTIPSDLEVDF